MHYRYSLTKLEFQRTHTLCALSMHFQLSLARAAITVLQLLVTEQGFAVAAQETKV